jgi:hypothetical protein
VTKRVLFVLGFVRAGTVVLAACSDDSDGTGSSGDSDPAEVVEGYVSAYNAQDIDRVMRLFAEGAVLIDGAERIEGTEAIRAEKLGGFENHAPGGEAYSISNLVVTDNAATWDHLFWGNCPHLRRVR